MKLLFICVALLLSLALGATNGEDEFWNELEGMAGWQALEEVPIPVSHDVTVPAVGNPLPLTSPFKSSSYSSIATTTTTSPTAPQNSTKTVIPVTALNGNDDEDDDFLDGGDGYVSEDGEYINEESDKDMDLDTDTESDNGLEEQYQHCNVEGDANEDDSDDDCFIVADDDLEAINELYDEDNVQVRMKEKPAKKDKNVGKEMSKTGEEPEMERKNVESEESAAKNKKKTKKGYELLATSFEALQRTLDSHFESPLRLARCQLLRYVRGLLYDICGSLLANWQTEWPGRLLVSVRNLSLPVEAAFTTKRSHQSGKDAKIVMVVYRDNLSKMLAAFGKTLPEGTICLRQADVLMELANLCDDLLKLAKKAGIKIDTNVKSDHVDEANGSEVEDSEDETDEKASMEKRVEGSSKKRKRDPAHKLRKARKIKQSPKDHDDGKEEEDNGATVERSSYHKIRRQTILDHFKELEALLADVHDDMPTRPSRRSIIVTLRETLRQAAVDLSAACDNDKIELTDEQVKQLNKMKKKPGMAFVRSSDQMNPEPVTNGMLREICDALGINGTVAELLEGLVHFSRWALKQQARL